MTFITGANFVKHLLPRDYMIRISGLEGKILDDVCTAWKIPFSRNDTYTYIVKTDAKFVIRALKMHQMEYISESKNRKRVKNVILLVERAVQYNIDATYVREVTMRGNNARDV